jgi:hypothetical protein
MDPDLPDGDDAPDLTPTADPPQTDGDGLIGRLGLIEERPLPDRADAFAQVHDELRDRLDRGATGA